MSGPPLISVVMSCYNGADRVSEGVGSVFSQTWSAVDLLVLDDGVLVWRCRWPIHAALTGRSAIDAVGGCDDQSPSNEDDDPWLGLGAFGRVVLTPQVLTYYHYHEGEQITNKRLKTFNHPNIQRKFIDGQLEVRRALAAEKVRDILPRELRRRYTSFRRDMDRSHAQFRKILLGRYWRLGDLKYALPPLLPYPLYAALVKRIRVRRHHGP